MHVSHPLIRENAVELRRYQEAVVARAVDGNTLVVLPTGLGKTLIAVMVAAHRLLKHPGSKVLLLAPTRPLVVQHKKTFEKIMVPQKTAVLTGMEAVSKRGGVFEENSIIFATPQTIENDLMRGLKLTDVSLVIFDEAHRAVGDYAYAYIAKKYVEQAKNPLILGLTASPSSEKEKVGEVVRNLHIKRVEAKTEHDRDVKPYVSEVKVRWIKVELPQEFKKVKTLLEEMLKDRLKKLKDFEYIESTELRRVNKRTLLSVQSDIRKEITQGIDSFVPASTVAEAIKINHALELLETQGLVNLNEYFKRLSAQRSRAVKNMFADPRLKEVMALAHDLAVLGVDHPKLEELSKLVSEFKAGKVLVFTQYRDSVEKIIDKLNESDILAHEFIGQAPRGAKAGMTQKKQMDVLEKFREGDYTALVATSVAEEGLDIPVVDLVVFYEPIPSEIRSIQRRGRTGRGASGQVAVLMAKGTRDEGYYWASVHKERRMSEVVRGLRDGGLKEQKNLLDYEPEVFESKEDVAMEKGFGQKSIMEYGVFGDGGVTVFVDARERSARIIDALRSKARVEIRNLAVGDYLVSDRVAVERKTVPDFLQSIIDKRLLSQLKELTRNFEHVILLIEGEQDIFSERNIHPNAVRGALSSILLDFRVPVISTRNEEDTAEFIFALARREQEGEGRLVALRGERKPLTLSERQIFVVESLPNVSAVLARRLLMHFGSVQAIVCASEKDLKCVEGIGDSKASEIRNVLQGRYGGRD